MGVKQNGRHRVVLCTRQRKQGRNSFGTRSSFQKRGAKTCVRNGGKMRCIPSRYRDKASLLQDSRSSTRHHRKSWIFLQTMQSYTAKISSSLYSLEATLQRAR